MYCSCQPSLTLVESASWMTSRPTLGRFSWMASTRRANASTPCGRRTRLPRGLPSGPGLAALRGALVELVELVEAQPRDVPLVGEDAVRVLRVGCVWTRRPVAERRRASSAGERLDAVVRVEEDAVLRGRGDRFLQARPAGGFVVELLLVADRLDVERDDAELRAEQAELIDEVVDLVDDLALGGVVVDVRLRRELAERLVLLQDDDGRLALRACAVRRRRPSGGVNSWSRVRSQRLK